MAAKGTKDAATNDTDRDRHLTFRKLVHRVTSEGEIPDVAVERLEVVAFASGECTYRYWLPRSDEPEGGYLPPPE